MEIGRVVPPPNGMAYVAFVTDDKKDQDLLENQIFVRLWWEQKTSRGLSVLQMPQITAIETEDVLSKTAGTSGGSAQRSAEALTLDFTLEIVNIRPQVSELFTSCFLKEKARKLTHHDALATGREQQYLVPEPRSPGNSILSAVLDQEAGTACRV